MSQKIQILPEQLCNKIAAGEVVERPASVVKELVENSLDAGATEIRLEVERGGKKLIRIIDDGSGMGREDALLCFERHATSKINSDDDLFRLHTLGFRGEALSSISSVSRFTLRTRTPDAVEGWEVYLEGGTVRRASAAGLPAGTSIEVRDLFFNTPARKKFLRKDETEFGHIGTIVNRLALANPHVQFRLLHNGRRVLEVYRHNTLEERVAELLGRPLLREMVELDVEAGGMRLKGLVSQPACNRSATEAIYTFINGRYVRDRVVQHAIMAGYRQTLLKGRYPVCVLFFTLDPAMVDVNVHPTKHEVRFRDQAAAHDFIASAVRDTLRPSAWVASAETEADAGDQAALTASPSPSAPAPEELRKGEIQEALGSYGAKMRSPSPFSWPAPPQGRASAAPSTPIAPLRIEPSEAAVSAQDEEQGYFGGLEILGQFRRSYLVCQDGDALVLIDQHAAHERIGFERLKAQYEKGGVERQALLFPAVVELDFREAALLQERIGDLERLGFEIEPFGGKSFALKAVPALLSEADGERLLLDVAAELASVGSSHAIEEAVDDILIRMACHGMVRANQTLAPSQMRALLHDLDGVDFKGHCPHGRPVLVNLSLGEIERMFKRS